MNRVKFSTESGVIEKGSLGRFFNAMHPLPYLSIVCLSSKFVHELKHIRYLMTGFEGNSEFSFPKTLNCSLS